MKTKSRKTTGRRQKILVAFLYVFFIGLLILVLVKGFYLINWLWGSHEVP